jgi:predicted DNA-binding antitoxin AbrB/MazE fold protein
MEAKVYPQIRAVHHDGVLELLDPIELPEGARVRLQIQSVLPGESAKLTFPTRLVSADKLDRLTALIEAGGDALADSEALYDADSH